MLASASLGATPVRQQGQVEGEVLQVFPGVIVIKNEEGLSLVLQLTRARRGEAPAGRQDRRLYYGISSVQLKRTRRSCRRCYSDFTSHRENGPVNLLDGRFFREELIHAGAPHGDFDFP